MAVMAPRRLKKRRKLPPPQAVIGPEFNGTLMTPEEYDRADFDENWVFELINGVLIVSPLPLMNEVDPNEELGYLLRRYREDHPQGAALDHTAGERRIKCGRNRRRADRVIWAGLGRLPRRGEHPTAVVEFVSSRKRDRERDYDAKRADYQKIKVREYWIIDRFEHTMTAFVRTNGKYRKEIVSKGGTYRTNLLPGFELPLARLFALADRWPEDQPE